MSGGDESSPLRYQRSSGERWGGVSPQAQLAAVRLFIGCPVAFES